MIDAFNSDKPYNQFIIEQLAADRLVADAIRRNGGNASGVDQTPLAALGFLTLGNRFENSANDIINDRIDVTTKAFLGLTVSCARCHDHKFDPIPTADYYSLYNVFANSAEPKEDAWLHPVPEDPRARGLPDADAGRGRGRRRPRTRRSRSCAGPACPQAERARSEGSS